MNQGATIAAALLAGLLSFLSPCVLPLVPSYISYVAGVSAPGQLVARRRTALAHAALFVSGFTLIFLLLGATATALGRLLNYYQVWLERAGGMLIVLFGLYLLGVLRVGVLAREWRVHLGTKPVGYLGSALVGVAFGAGWTPCIGPILGSILLYTSTRADLGEGLVLLLAYSAGLAVPFLVAAWALEGFLRRLKGMQRSLWVVEKVAGALLVVVGLMLLTGTFSLLSNWLQALTPELLRSRL